MTLQSHLAELERRHEALGAEIEKEQVHPATDEIKLCALKKRKLRLRDEIQRLRVPTRTETSLH
jgi:hypothetical protein